MIIGKYSKMIYFVVIVFLLLFLTGMQSVNAAVSGTTTSFSVRDYGSAGLYYDDSPGGLGNYYGWIQDTGFVTEHFFEFDISAINSSHNAFLDIDLWNNTTSNPDHGVAHDVSLAYYSGTGSPSISLFGTGTPQQTLTLLTSGLNSYKIDVTNIFSAFRSSGDNYLGFRLYDSVWSDDNTAGQQMEYVTSSLTTTVVPEPVSTTLFIIGGVLLGGRGFLKRKRNK